MKLTYFKVLGEQNEQSLIILHGFLGSSDNWTSLARQFAEKYKVYLVDQRNHGRSFWDESFDYQALAEDLGNLIEAENIQKPLLLGHSMGGKTIIEFAKKQPDLPLALIVADMGIKRNQDQHSYLLDAMMSMDLENLQDRNEADQHLAQSEKDFGVRQFLLKNLYRNEQNQFAWRVNLAVLKPALSKVLDEIRLEKPIETPTFFVRGTKSSYVLDSDWQNLQVWFPDSELASIDAGHWVHAEKPVEFYATVMAYLKKNSF